MCIRDRARSGQYTVRPDELENDLDYLKEHGYTAVFMQDLIDYVYHGKELPAKPVVITFDDGFYNNWYYVLPMLKERNMKAVISVVGSYTEKLSLIHI